MPWKMFLIAPTSLCRISLRRYSHLKSIIGNTAVGFKDVEKPCPRKNDYSHDACVVIAEQVEYKDEICGGRYSGKGEFANDPRWPVKCAHCDYVFEMDTPWQMSDQWQVNYETLWKGSPDGKLYVLRGTPPGATWIADWFPNEGPNGEWSGPDGRVWCVMMPGGLEFIVYAHSTTKGPKGEMVKGEKWSVHGTIPNITVHPSINITGYYHGLITSGVISDDCEGRKFPQWPSTA